MKIEAVVVSVNHADFLAHTLPLNLRHFDRMVIVTAPEDRHTRRVCEAYGVTCKPTDALMSRWGLFVKGAGINEGLRRLDRDQWMVQLDADIVLPSHFRDALETADLDTSMIYGCDRQMFRSYADWMKFFESPLGQVEDVLIHPSNSGMPLGARVHHPGHQGYYPLGFLQLWHADSGITSYIADQTNAARDDTHFACQWPRKKRALIPEVVVYHLESEPGDMGANWKGRKTKPFMAHPPAAEREPIY